MVYWSALAQFKNIVVVVKSSLDCVLTLLSVDGLIVIWYLIMGDVDCGGASHVTTASKNILVGSPYWRLISMFVGTPGGTPGGVNTAPTSVIVQSDALLLGIPRPGRPAALAAWIRASLSWYRVWLISSMSRWSQEGVVLSWRRVVIYCNGAKFGKHVGLRTEGELHPLIPIPASTL